MSAMSAATIAFLIPAGLLFYVYLGYPVLMLLLARMFGRTAARGSCRPTVTAVVTTYNEERGIGAKLDNLLALDYPREQMDILVVDDLSSDDTVKAVSDYSVRNPTIRLKRLEKRSGKTEAQNAGAEAATGEVLFFTDVTACHEPGMLARMLESLADPRVACTSGSFRYSSAGRTEALGLYARYEDLVRRCESDFKSALWLAGCGYLVRKSDYIPLSGDLVSDFAEPLLLAASGKRVVFDPGVVTLVERSVTDRSEFSRRGRIASQGLWCLWRNKHLFNPFRYPYISFVLLSRRLLRWLAGIFFLAALAASLLGMDDPFLRAALWLQLGLYGSALLGFWGLRVFRPFTVLMIQVLAGLAGLMNFLAGRRFTFWETSRSRQQ